MENFSFASFETVLEKSWNAFKTNFFRVLGLAIIAFLIILGVYLLFVAIIFLTILTETLPSMASIPLAIILGALALGALLTVYFAFALSAIRMLLKAVHSEKMTIQDLWFGFSYKKKAWCLMGAMIAKMTTWFTLIPFIAATIFFLIDFQNATMNADPEMIDPAAILKTSSGGVSFIILIIAFIAMVIESYWRLAKYNLMPFMAVENLESNVLPLGEKSAEMMNGSKWYYILMIIIIFCVSIILQLLFGLLIADKNAAALTTLAVTLPFTIFTSFFGAAFYTTLKELKTKNK